MKICVVTVYNSYNYGSFLQAAALNQVLQEYGDVYFLDTHSRSLLKPAADMIIKNLVRLRLKSVLFEMKKLACFIRNQSVFKKVELKELNAGDFDAAIFGSDEIWNLHRKSFMEYPVFWGEAIKGIMKISYAPSLGNTSSEELIKSGYAEKYLSDFKMISVRDEYSKTILAARSEKYINKVLDPTLLLNKEFYLQKKYELNCSDYIALYFFIDKTKQAADTIRLLQAIAKNTGRKLVSVGVNYGWCDLSVCQKDLYVFNVFEKADFIITNTFHGTAFSIIFEKQFITLAREKCKVAELLKEFHLSDREVGGMELGEILPVLYQRIDYDAINKLRTLKQERSLFYLNYSLMQEKIYSESEG